MELDASKVPVIDDIDVKTIKECKVALVPVLCKLFNQSFRNGEVPEGCKIARVRPIFKSNDHDQPENYRPVSILPIISKILEHIVNQNLLDYLEGLKYFSKFQYGFRRSSDTTSAVVDLISEIQLLHDQGKKCALVSLDLCKAFDTVNFNILLDKLNLLGINNQTWDWFYNFLNGRTQMVHIGQTIGSGRKIMNGVPQGSVFAPTFFLIYINSISKLDLKGKVFLYADDTTLLYTSENNENIVKYMQEDLNKIEKCLI